MFHFLYYNIYFKFSFLRCGGNDCAILSALLLSLTFNVTKYLLKRSLNLVILPIFFIFTNFASL